MEICRGHSAKITQIELKMPKNDFPGVKDALKGLGGSQGPNAPSRLILLNPKIAINCPQGSGTLRQQYARVCRSMPEYARVCQSMHEYARVCQSMPEYARVCQSMPECARVCQSMPESCQVLPK